MDSAVYEIGNWPTAYLCGDGLGATGVPALVLAAVC